MYKVNLFFLVIIIVVVGVFSSSISAESTEDGTLGSTEQAVGAGEAAQRPEFIKQTSFKLSDGSIVSGKVILEDRERIVLEELEKGSILVNTYLKMDIDRRTMRSKKVPEVKYFIDTGDYFAGSIWDFKNDPDDFIQAIRLYEKAIQSLSAEAKDNSQRIAELRKKIEKLQADREVWVRETESRSKLKKLELEAVVESRLKELTAKVADNTKTSEDLAQLSTQLQEIQSNITQIQNGLTALSEENQILHNNLDTRLEEHERILGRYYNRRYDFNTYQRRNTGN